ncbi:hypothetical protein DPMN_079107 [Dreissena polymorpha]|uniref:Uncharacterized protein n=1 Tax=Dreissena polymorpha TaxID=45954 RepID=A0A9D3YNX5_DREPO|nr:hypothetical protein DPMN_079107 [Dreissena polymorpha]
MSGLWEMDPSQIILQCMQRGGAVCEGGFLRVGWGRYPGSCEEHGQQRSSARGSRQGMENQVVPATTGLIDPVWSILNVACDSDL